jgi:deoxyribose-phosphate aldolase
MDKHTLAGYLDLANHHQEAKPEDIKLLCKKVKEFGFHSAFVNPYFVPLARDLMGEKGIVGTVVSFPLGQELTDIKVLSAVESARKGADELDISMNVGLFKAGRQVDVLEEMKAVVQSAKSLKPKVVVKFIIETGCLTPEEIKKASELVLLSGADFVKSCSGMGPRGANLEDVKLIKEVIGDKIKIKVAGGIDSLKKAVDFINAGANRIGTSKAVEIIEEKQP